MNRPRLVDLSDIFGQPTFVNPDQVVSVEVDQNYPRTTIYLSNRFHLDVEGDHSKNIVSLLLYTSC